MLVVATAVFVYYTVWTLLMVRYLARIQSAVSHTHLAIRRRLTSITISLPSSGLGHQDPRHLDPSWRSSRGELLIASDDQEQQEEGVEGEAGWKGKMTATCHRQR